MNELTTSNTIPNINNYINELELELTYEGDDEAFEVAKLKQKKEELLATQAKIQKLLCTIDQRVQKIQEKIGTETITAQKDFTRATEKVSQIAPCMLVVHTDRIITSKDNGGDIKHYAVSFISKNGEKIEVIKYPIDIEKYGEIKNIIISDGKNEKPLLSGYAPVKRLIKYFSVDFETLRKEINVVDHNGFYSNRDQKFDCQRFSYYIKSGKEGNFAPPYGLKNISNYRETADHLEYCSYSMRGYTRDFATNGDYKGKDQSLHHYVCLADDVFVSKFGSGDVFFTSFQHILDAYFPPQFVKGTFSMESL